MGFDTYSLLQSLIEHKAFAFVNPVKYYKKLPKFEINISKELVDLAFGMLAPLFAKSHNWAYEEEIRIITAKPNTTIKFNTHNIKEVILGLKMSIKNKQELIKVTKRIYPDAKIYEVVQQFDEFKIGVKEVLV